MILPPLPFILFYSIKGVFVLLMILIFLGAKERWGDPKSIKNR
jgi:hypothetical protein